MTLRTLLDRFDLLMDTPESVPKLRQFILQLAVEGRLTQQKDVDEPADALLKRIKGKNQELLAENDSPRRKSLDDMLDEFPFEVPENWTWTRLDDVCPYIQRGKRPDYSEEEKIPVVSQKCVQWEGFKPNRVRFIDPDSLDKYQSYRFLQDRDLLWNSTGVGTVGRINVYHGELNEYPRVVADSHVTIVRPIKEMVLPEYIYCWIASSHIQSKIETGMTSGTTKQTELNTSTVRETLLPLPPLEEQQRIVEKADGLMDECDVLEHQQERERTLQVQVGTAATEALQSADNAEDLRPAWERVREHFDTVTATPEGVDALRQTILRLAVQGRFTERDPNDTPADVLLEQIQKEKQRLYDAGEIRKPKTYGSVSQNEIPFDIPKNWSWAYLGTIGTWGAGATPKRSEAKYWDGGTIPWLKIGDLNNGRVYEAEEAVTQEALEECSLRENRPGDIAIAMYGASIGKLGYLEIDCVTNQAICVCTPMGATSGKYLFYFLEAAQRIFEDLGAGGAQPNISKTKIVNTPFPVPPPEEQQRLVEVADRLLSSCDDLGDLISSSSERGEQLLEAALRDASLDRPDTVSTGATA